MTLSAQHPRRRVLAFRGTRRQFLTYLAGLVPADLYRDGPLDEEYDWELTCSIARHPAGKGLGR